MKEKRKGHLTTANTRQVYNCKVTDFQCNSQESGVKIMRELLDEAGRIPVCPRSGKISLLHLINEMKGGLR